MKRYFIIQRTKKLAQIHWCKNFNNYKICTEHIFKNENFTYQSEFKNGFKNLIVDMLCFVDFFIWMRVLGYKKILAVRDVVYEKNPEDSNDSKIEK